MNRTADRDGIMVWSEIPNWQNISFDKPEAYAKDVIMLNEIIRRDRNKPSVILWSVSNETGNNPTRTKFLTDLVNEAREVDPTRPIISALDSEHIQGSTATLDAPLRPPLMLSESTSISAGTEARPKMPTICIGCFLKSPSS
jgi:beta-glucuronidase